MPITFSVRRRIAKATRIALAASVIAGGAVGTALATEPTAYAATTAATSTVGGKISRTEIIERAKYWLDKGLIYNQGGSYTDSSGKSYRTDCSGYVSMAWHLSWSPNTIALNESSYPINFNDLKPGDILNSDEHVFIFAQWENAAKTSFSYYSFGSTPVKYRTVSTGDANWDGHPRGTYTPRRYHNVIDEPSVKNTVHLQRVTPGGDLFNAEGDYSAGRWSGWTNQGATQLKEVTSAGTGTVNRVFALGGDNRIYENDGDYATGKWTGWTLLDGAPQAKAVSASSDGNTVHLVAIGLDGHLYNSDRDFTAGKWNGWTDHGGNNLKRVTSATTSDHVNHIYAVDGSDQIQELDADYGAGKWNNWQVAGPAGGFQAQDVTASVSGTTVHLGAIGMDGNWYNTDGDFARGTWNGWWNGGGGNLKRLTSAMANNVNHVYAIRTDNTLTERDGDYTAGRWNDWATPAGGGEAISLTASFTQ
ncbi:hypothetical protein ACIPW5_03830 [Streptomyces sp. NPDC090077]|uniref:hypothetical protein n=1 Tax=Streptomyces sp. NPDC090077 TaxID=3365938 RepID=UPI003818267C